MTVIEFSRRPPRIRVSGNRLDMGWSLGYNEDRLGAAMIEFTPILSS
ncbi:hypothetical protein RMSM_05219 [Rhodopirellula maiorica SM1]|uniref:Uncharacterized protein n=1 Tax=Rhodopirellula maiorica SM1 TaxID=1265738 RepID=M5RFL1_9BACT|nr:hypothetical protein RMSM_05219 [Rhodopirellula maiorica SM1]